jgi:imidazole glycerol-phosphate synthase subunit HisF
MLAKRIIPCLDVKNGRVVKGVNFVNLKDAGDPVDCAKMYDKQKADELVFLDITASYEKRGTMIEIVKKVADNIFIPFTVGGGIRNITDMDNLLSAGCDKISINTSAVVNPDLINQGSEKFGAQCIVVAIDAKQIDGKWKVTINGGRDIVDKYVVDWAKECQNRGAGEILLTSMAGDGTTDGFDIPLNYEVAKAVSIPVIASGGAGELQHFLDVFKKTSVSAALAASVFHYNKYTVNDVKKYLADNGINVRM